MNGNVGLSDPPLVAAGFGVLSIDNSAATASARLSDSSSPEKQNKVNLVNIASVRMIYSAM